MTVLITVVKDDCVIQYTDGATYTQGGIYFLPMQKSDIFLPQTALVATRGSGRAGMIFKFLASETASFDEIVSKLPTFLSQASIEGLKIGDPVNLSAHVAGYSEAHGAFQAFWSFVRREEDGDLAEGSLKVEPIASVHVDPWPGVEELSATGLLNDGVVSISGEDDFLAIIEAVRRTTFPFGPGHDGEGCIVGGFIQRTTLTLDSATSDIIHRWPDVVGELLRVRGD